MGRKEGTLKKKQPWVKLHGKNAGSQESELEWLNISRLQRHFDSERVLGYYFCLKAEFPDCEHGYIDLSDEDAIIIIADKYLLDEAYLQEVISYAVQRKIFTLSPDLKLSYSLHDKDSIKLQEKRKRDRDNRRGSYRERESTKNDLSATRNDEKPLIVDENENLFIVDEKPLTVNDKPLIVDDKPLIGDDRRRGVSMKSKEIISSLRSKDIIKKKKEASKLAKKKEKDRSLLAFSENKQDPDPDQELITDLADMYTQYMITHKKKKIPCPISYAAKVRREWENKPEEREIAHEKMTSHALFLMRQEEAANLTNKPFKIDPQASRTGGILLAQHKFKNLTPFEREELIEQAKKKSKFTKDPPKAVLDSLAIEILAERELKGEKS